MEQQHKFFYCTTVPRHLPVCFGVAQLMQESSHQFKQDLLQPQNDTLAVPGLGQTPMLLFSIFADIKNVLFYIICISLFKITPDFAD